MWPAGRLSGIHLIQPRPLMHLFPSEISLPERFNDPFRYSPHPSVRIAAEMLMQRIEASEELSSIFAEGKMLGVLVVSDASGQPGYLCAFSGNVAGKSHLEGFVPPIFDLLDPSGHFKIREAEITAMNSAVSAAEEGEFLARQRLLLTEAERNRDEEIGILKARAAISKRERDILRKETEDAGTIAALTRESQFEKAEIRRVKIVWEEKIRIIREDIEAIEADIRAMKKRRADMSDRLQKWIFSQYIVHNAHGHACSIGEIFESQGLVPPGGTGECAAPKLLEYAYRNGLKPLAMGEFWYGLSPDTAVRTQGHFYPSCTSKCGPLLNYMLEGLEIETEVFPACGKPEVIYEDEFVIIVSKPSGMPSVPGLVERESLEQWLCSKYGQKIFPVHRLDMDTSGIMIFARDEASAVSLQRQFELHSISKTYRARLSGSEKEKQLKAGEKGEIRLCLNADYDERPRQKVDPQQGKSAVTAYEITSVHPDGSADVTFHPHTGRTHQLRVHSSHILGLGHPIEGDLLYGGFPASRLHLHAFSISFDHPATGERLTFSTSLNSYCHDQSCR